MTSPLAHELDVARRLARNAGRILLEVYATDFDVVEKPGGAGPVTEADERANAYLVAELKRAFPGDGVVSEEAADTSEAARFARCWFVDPMDGTREFVARNGQFAVQVGLAIEGTPVLGVVYCPPSDKLYAGLVGQECSLEVVGERRALRVADVLEPTELRLVVSRSHRSRRTELMRSELGITRVMESGSVGLKCGLLAEGVADLYLHPSDRSYRWDACGPEAILRAAGGVLTDFAGRPYRYDGREMRNTRGLIGCSAAVFPRVLPVLERIARETGLLSAEA
ncbi:MAG: 3'(2'),5'-bisphosphate nucleotidase CysQ [Myxococcaceae bacterium]|nr:3'(2'),5'-bisphosphate nucleotidase CysQ [Myxococcaceae bacterium]